MRTSRQDFPRLIWALAFTACACVLSPAIAGAQGCTTTAQTQDLSGTNYVRMLASTTQEGCTNRETQVAAWIQGRQITCVTGVMQGDGKCAMNNTEGGNAAVTVNSAGPVCGDYYGKSEHGWVQPPSYGVVGESPRNSLLSAQACEEDCVPIVGGGTTCDQPPTPIIIATRKGTRYQLTSAEAGVWFDIDGDGTVEQIAWTAEGTDIASLALDRDGDGRITSGKELFGNFTLPGARNGFQALQLMAMASNGGIRRGSVSTDDPIFGRLLLWTDDNHNDISETWELRRAADVLSDIGLGYEITSQVDRFGNRFRYMGWANVRTAPGRNDAKDPRDDERRRRQIYDVYLVGGQ